MQRPSDGPYLVAYASSVALERQLGRIGSRHAGVLAVVVPAGPVTTLRLTYEVLRRLGKEPSLLPLAMPEREATELVTTWLLAHAIRDLVLIGSDRMAIEAVRAAVLISKSVGCRLWLMHPRRSSGGSSTGPREMPQVGRSLGGMDALELRVPDRRRVLIPPLEGPTDAALVEAILRRSFALRSGYNVSAAAVASALADLLGTRIVDRTVLASAQAATLFLGRDLSASPSLLETTAVSIGRTSTPPWTDLRRRADPFVAAAGALWLCCPDLHRLSAVRAADVDLDRATVDLGDRQIRLPPDAVPFIRAQVVHTRRSDDGSDRFLLGAAAQRPSIPRVRAAVRASLEPVVGWSLDMPTRRRSRDELLLADLGLAVGDIRVLPTWPPDLVRLVRALRIRSIGTTP